MISCDTLIAPKFLVPVVPAGEVWVDYALAVNAGRIVAIGPYAELKTQYAPMVLKELPTHALIPGLVNTHVHAAMSLMGGIADDLPLMKWLSEHIWPAEAKHVSPEFVECGVEAAIVEQISSGVTTMQDMYFFGEHSAKIADRFGMRAVVGAIAIEFPSAYASTVDEYFSKADALIKHYAGHPLIRVSLAPHAPYTVSDASFTRLLKLSEEHNLRIHCHIHETAGEVDDSLKQYGMRPLERLRQLGLINERLNAVHMTQLTDAEVAGLADAKASVLHCPESNLKLASGFCPVQKLLHAGVNVALGTDGSASNNDLDLLGEMKTAALLAKGVAMDATAFNSAQALHAATLGGAQALGLAEQIGSLEVGKQADLCALNLGELESQPIFNAISHIVYANHRRQVSDVWIAGQAKLASGVLLEHDGASLRAKLRSWAKKLGAYAC
jgi:5-methylthioadenosine/S-adenosylhomocysteine deaminase